MFNEVFRRCNTYNMAFIGDTPSIDIRGANNVGITSVLVETGGGWWIWGHCRRRTGRITGWGVGGLVVWCGFT